MTMVEGTSRRHFLVLSGTGLVGLLVGCRTKSDDASGADNWDDRNGVDVGEPDVGGGESGETAAGASDSGGMETGDSESGGSGSDGTEAGGAGEGTTTDTGNASVDTGTGGSTSDTGGHDSDDAPDECMETESDIEGPFYRSDAPIRSDLDLYGDAGTVLLLSGRVLDLDCNPIPGAVVEIWHADPTTVPVDELTASDSVGYDNTSGEMRYRAQIAADAEGRYSFRTKKPGWYLNGARFRPMHFHMKVWVGGVERLTTQLYFEGDPYIEGDAWASLDRALRVVSEGDGVESARFDFTVESVASSKK